MWQDTARRQGGVIRRDQLRAGGLSNRQIDTVLARGDLRRTGPRAVLAVAGAPSTEETAWWTAVLATRGVLSHLSAARSWDLPVPDDRGIHVTVATDATSTRPAGVILHRVALPRIAITDRFGLPITTPTRTVLDCIGVLPVAAARVLLDRALQVRAVQIADLERRLVAEPSRSGNRQIDQLRRELTGAAAESERILHRLLHAAGLAGWRPNVRIRINGRDYEIDVAFDDAGLAVEVDGWAHHANVDRFRADRRKQNALTLAGWTVIRFTWADLTERPDYVIGLTRNRGYSPTHTGVE